MRSLSVEVNVISPINLHLPAESVILPCNYTSISRSVPVVITWIYSNRSQKCAITRWTDEDVIGGEKYDISSKHGNCSLRIHKPWVGDSRNYSVTVEAYDLGYDQAVVQLIVDTSLVTSGKIDFITENMLSIEYL